VAELLEKRSEDFSRAEILDQGKTMDNAKNNNNDEYGSEANMIRLLVGQAISALDQATSDNGELTKVLSKITEVFFLIDTHFSSQLKLHSLCIPQGGAGDFKGGFQIF
jgi:hypothetical protein